MTDKVIQIASPVIAGKQPLVVLTASGKIYQRDLDKASEFNRGPNVPLLYTWTEIKGPLGE